MRIRLVNLNVQDVNDPNVDLEVDFDDVQLDATPLAEADFDRDVDGADLATWETAYAASAASNTDDDVDSDGG